jgi:TonB family protein
MKIRQQIVTAVAAMLLAAPMVKGEGGLDIKLLVFEGVRPMETVREPVVIASYLHPTVTANIPGLESLEEVEKQIKRIFNLVNVTLLTEADLQWSPPGNEPGEHFFRLNGHSYHIEVQPGTDWAWAKRLDFRILVNESVTDNPEKTKKVLSTSFSLSAGNIAVFGFETGDGRPYFLSVHISRISPAPRGKSPGPSDEFTKGAVLAVGDIVPPKLIKRVDPVYPQEAREAKIQGVVILGCRTNTQGEVEAVEVYRKVDPFLDKAAADAVLQWKYEPFIIDGRPRKVVFTVTVRFKLK